MAAGGGQLVAGSYGSVFRIDPATGRVVRTTMLGSIVGIGDYETRVVIDGQHLTVGSHGYVYDVSLIP